MTNDYSEYQGSDYYHVPQKPKQNNLLDGFNAALQAFVSIKSKKAEIDNANTEKVKKEKLLGLKMQQDEEDRQMKREELKSNINYKNKQTELLGSQKENIPQSSLIKEANVEYDNFMKGVSGYEVESKDEYGMPTKTKPQDINAYLKTTIGNRQARSVYNNLRQAKESGAKLSSNQEEILDEFAKLLGKTSDEPDDYSQVDESNIEDEPMTPEPQKGPSITSVLTKTGRPTLRNPNGSASTQPSGMQGIIGELTSKPKNDANSFFGANNPEPTQGPLMAQDRVAPVLESKDKFDVAAIGAAKGISDFGKKIAASEIVKKVMGAGSSAFESISEAGSIIRDVVTGSSAGASKWVKSREDVDIGIMDALDNPKENRQILLIIRDNPKLYEERLTEDGKRRLLEAYAEAEIQDGPKAKAKPQMKHYFGSQL